MAEHNPILILLDVNLPDMSGFEVCQLIKKDPQDQRHADSAHLRLQRPVLSPGAWTEFRRGQLSGRADGPGGSDRDHSRLFFERAQAEEALRRVE